MTCNDTQSILKKLHAPITAMVFIGETEADDALKHASECSDCKTWIKEELCERLKEQAKNNNLGEGVLMNHGMIHEALDIDCPTFDDSGNLKV